MLEGKALQADKSQPATCDRYLCSRFAALCPIWLSAWQGWTHTKEMLVLPSLRELAWFSMKVNKLKYCSPYSLLSRKPTLPNHTPKRLTMKVKRKGCSQAGSASPEQSRHLGLPSRWDQLYWPLLTVWWILAIQPQPKTRVTQPHRNDMGVVKWANHTSPACSSPPRSVHAGEVVLGQHRRILCELQTWSYGTQGSTTSLVRSESPKAPSVHFPRQRLWQ